MSDEDDPLNALRLHTRASMVVNYVIEHESSNLFDIDVLKNTQLTTIVTIMEEMESDKVIQDADDFMKELARRVQLTDGIEERSNVTMKTN